MCYCLYNIHIWCWQLHGLTDTYRKNPLGNKKLPSGSTSTSCPYIPYCISFPKSETVTGSISAPYKPDIVSFILLFMLLDIISGYWMKYYLLEWKLFVPISVCTLCALSAAASVEVHTCIGYSSIHLPGTRIRASYTSVCAKHFASLPPCYGKASLQFIHQGSFYMKQSSSNALNVCNRRLNIPPLLRFSFSSRL